MEYGVLPSSANVMCFLLIGGEILYAQREVLFFFDSACDFLDILYLFPLEGTRNCPASSEELQLVQHSFRSTTLECPERLYQ